jgi:hypothetical protein
MTFGVDPDPHLDPDPSIFVNNLEDANKKLFFFSCSAYCFLKVHLQHFSRKKVKKVTTVGTKVFLTIFA